jgi:HSP20 family protein
VEPDDIDIDISSESVTIRGERRRSNEVSEDSYLYQECYWGKFSRSIILPQEIDPDKAKAEFKNGVLRVRLPKIAKGKTRKLKVRGEE